MRLPLAAAPLTAPKVSTGCRTPLLAAATQLGRLIPFRVEHLGHTGPRVLGRIGLLFLFCSLILAIGSVNQLSLKTVSRTADPQHVLIHLFKLFVGGVVVVNAGRQAVA